MRNITVPESIRRDFEYWRNFLYSQVHFSFAGSQDHTKEHCERVLLFALMIADKLDVSARGCKILCTAAVFHDSRRRDDWLDVGHGARAARYYKEFCEKHPDDARSLVSFESIAFKIMFFHDQDDEIGEVAIAGDSTSRIEVTETGDFLEANKGPKADDISDTAKQLITDDAFPPNEALMLDDVMTADDALMLYRIFKDADALDRFRLGPQGFDARYLRTDAAKSLVDFAKRMWLDR